ncbi:peptidase A4 family-domain-containing protein [Boletus edulis]|nr:peptidase A4 family-domain-containing protein [Boletus edulis]
MRFNSGLISCFSLASAVLAELAGARIDSGDSGTFDTITGILVAPILSGDPDSAVAVWMSIDSDGNVGECPNYVVASLISTVTSDGTQHQASMRWFPQSPVDFPLNMVSGDRVQVTFNASESRSGALTFNNLSRGQSVTKEEFRTDYPLCGRYANWMVGRVAVNGAKVPLANFSRLTIQSTSAGAWYGPSYGPAAATILFQMPTDHGGVVQPLTDNDTISFEADGYVGLQRR